MDVLDSDTRSLSEGIYGGETEDIIGKAPIWIVRYGTGSFLALCLLLLGGSFVIKYSDFADGVIQVETQRPASMIWLPSGARVVKLTHKSGDFVIKGDILAIVNSEAAINDVSKLTLLLHTDSLLSKKPFVEAEISRMNLGELSYISEMLQKGAPSHDSFGKIHARLKYNTGRVFEAEKGLYRNQEIMDSLAGMLKELSIQGNGSPNMDFKFDERKYEEMRKELFYFSLRLKAMLSKRSLSNFNYKDWISASRNELTTWYAEHTICAPTGGRITYQYDKAGNDEHSKGIRSFEISGTFGQDETVKAIFATKYSSEIPIGGTGYVFQSASFPIKKDTLLEVQVKSIRPSNDQNKMIVDLKPVRKFSTRQNIQLDPAGTVVIKLERKSLFQRFFGSM